MTAFTPDTGKVFWVEMLGSFRQNLKSQFSFVRFYSERKRTPLEFQNFPALFDWHLL